MQINPLSAETTLALMQSQQTPDTASAKNTKRINEVAREFESVFISEMVKPMFEGLKPNEMFGGGKGEEIFRNMMIQEYGKKIASLDVIGIQTQVKNKLIELQSAKTAQNHTSALQAGHVIDLEPIEEK